MYNKSIQLANRNIGKCNIIRTSNKNLHDENFSSLKRNASKCKIDAYRNDQYGNRTSVSSSTRTARQSYNTIINNPSNTSISAPTAYIELSNNYIFQYLPKNTIIGKIYVNNSKNFYEFYLLDKNNFYIKNNILYSNRTFTIDDNDNIDIHIFAKICIDNSIECNNLNRKFKIKVINTLKIQNILSICDIDYVTNSDLLSYLNLKERNNISILKNIDWFNYYDNKILEKNYIRDTSYIKNEEQLYRIAIITEYYDHNGEFKKIVSIFKKKILNNIFIKGEFVEGNTLEIEFNSDNNSFKKHTRYFWWVIDKDNNYKILNSSNTKFYTLTQNEVNKLLFASVLYRNDETIVIRSINSSKELVKNKNNATKGYISIDGYYNVGETILLNENISDSDGITSKTITWYISQKTDEIKNIIYEWQLSNNNGSTWTPVEFSNYELFNIPNDDSYLTKIIRVKADVYDSYGNYTTFYSENSEPIYKNNTLNEKYYDFILKGDAIIGKQLIIEQNNKNIEVETIKYIWQRSRNFTSWSNIDTNIYNNTFNIPIEQQSIYLYKYIRCIIYVTEKNGNVINYYTNTSNQIENYELFPDGNIIIEGKAIEGFKINALFSLNDTSLNINDYTLEYIWEISNNKIIWTPMSRDINYSLQLGDNNDVEYDNTVDGNNIISDDKKNVLIPLNGSFLNMYLRCRMSIIDKSYNYYYLISNVTSKIKNNDISATGELYIDGVPEFGETLSTRFENLNDPDGYIITISYVWQYTSTPGKSWKNIENYDNHSFYDIPYDFTENNYIQVLATTTDNFGGTTTFISNSVQIKSKEQEENSKIVLSGNSIENSTLSVIIIDNDLKNEKNIVYEWEYSFNKSEWYDININKSSFTIPNDNTFTGKFLRANIIYIDKNNKAIKNTTPSSNRIKNLNNDAEGKLSIKGNPTLGMKLNATFTGLIDKDMVYLDENNIPYREKNILLNETHKKYKFKSSISYIDNYGYSGILYSKYTPVITNANNLFNTIPRPPCSFFSEITSQQFLTSLDDCGHIIIGIGGIVSLDDNFVLKGGYRLIIDGGTLNIINSNIEIENDAIFIIKGKGVFNLNGNLVSNERSTIMYDDDTYNTYDDYLILQENPICYISYKASLTILKSILDICDKVFLVTNGSLILKENYTLPENKIIVIEKDSQLNLFNCNLIMSTNSRIIIYGNMNISGSIITKDLGQIIVEKSGLFNSYSVRSSDIIQITTTIHISEMYDLFDKNFEIIVTGDGNIDNPNNEDFIIKSNNSLIIDKNSKILIYNSILKIENGGSLNILGKFINDKGIIDVEFNGYLNIGEEGELTLN